jgi:SAM-dependent methyltransferase
MQPELFAQMREVEDLHWWFQGRRQIVSTLMDDFDLPSTARILDLGCGTGGNLEWLSGFGEVTGIEHDPAAAGMAAGRNHGKVLRGSLPESLPPGLPRFDCITMFDVLEHIPRDAESLSAVLELLEPGGFLLLTVPAFMFLWGPHDVAHHHQRRYRASGLKSLLAAAGFDVVKTSYYNIWLFPPVALVRLMRKVLPSGEGGMEAGLPPLWLNRFLQALFASERHLLRRMNLPFGVSLVAVARKPVRPGAA